MRRSFIIATAAFSLLAGFVGFVSTATAGSRDDPDGISISSGCNSSGYRNGGSSRCSTVIEPYYAPRMTKEEIRERDERIAKWEAYCQPVGKRDEFGVVRLQYRVKGCEFGKSED